MDVANDPLAVYEAVLAQKPPRRPVAAPCYLGQPARGAVGHAPYAAWLGQIHARWLADGRPVPIRFFDSLIASLGGAPERERGRRP